ncbi:MAG: LytR/AlgR family response regulator transcription factor [Limisphaerales bacterium]
MKLSALIVDDEPPARSKIRNFLAARADIDVLGEAGDGVEAIEKIIQLRPDLVFLDIQMPRGDGFDVLREVYPHHKPMIIFTTAYDEYAIRGFEVEALDYLLKPFTAERFHKAIERAVRQRDSGTDLADKMLRLLDEARRSARRAQRILVRGKDRLFFLKTSEIEWAEAEEKYVLLHTRSERHLLRQSISALEAQLAPASFVRIHRCYLVNIEAVRELLPMGQGDCVAVLKSGLRLNVGRSYKDRLLDAMGEPLKRPAPQ